eukprot:TRINITY_DN4746_c0_g1_i1.p1 TRINITY_DN4746_c0_g1~~TRINITY_DN4746_c0_g1_i1.p1  ORF type:complete len:737 (-),score=175.14 TRINITY_DN4746_c0_g1_i1:35-2245(-)
MEDRRASTTKRSAGKLKIRIIAARNLPLVSQSDVFVALAFEGRSFTTPPAPQSAIQWDTAFNFDVSSQASILTFAVVPLSGLPIGALHFNLRDTERLRESDQWYPLRKPNTLSTAAGELRMEVRYLPPRNIFGASLEQVQARASGRVPIPICIQKMVDFLSSEEALRSEGIFRVPGEVTDVNWLRDQFNEDEDGFEIPAGTHIFTVASLLKKFFHDLPEPLLSFDLFDRFLEADGMPSAEQRIAVLRDLVRTLPADRVRVIDFLFTYLRKVLQLAHVNKMTATNIGIVFGPTLLRAQDMASRSAQMMMTQSKVVPRVISALVQNFDFIFYRNFGAPLDVLLRRKTVNGVPLVLYKMIEYIRRNGLNEPDLFSSASAQEAQHLRALLDGDDEAGVPQVDAGVVARVLRMFLREMPDSLLPESLFQETLNAAEKPEELQRQAALWTIVHDVKITADNRQVLEYVCRFLHEFTLHSVKNKTTPTALAVIFAPNIIHPHAESGVSMKRNAVLVSTAFQVLIQFPDIIFSETNPFPEEADASEEEEHSVPQPDVELLILDARRRLQQASQAAALAGGDSGASRMQSVSLERDVLKRISVANQELAFIRARVGSAKMSPALGQSPGVSNQQHQRAMERVTQELTDAAHDADARADDEIEKLQNDAQLMQELIDRCNEAVSQASISQAQQSTKSDLLARVAKLQQQIEQERALREKLEQRHAAVDRGTPGLKHTSETAMPLVE